MKSLIFKVLLRLLGRYHYEPLSKKAVDNLLFNLANEEGFERLPDFLQQCADQYRNQFLYTGEAQFKGTVLAFVSLRERILEKKTTVKSTKKKKSKKDKNKGKVEKVVY